MSKAPFIRSVFDHGFHTAGNRTKAPQGSIVDGQNIRIDENNSIFARDGYELIGALPSNAVVGHAYYEGDLSSNPVVSDGLNVWVKEGASWILVGQFPEQGTVFHADMGFGRLYMVNGKSRAYRLRKFKDSNSIVKWEFRSVGVNAPGTPTGSGAGGGGGVIFDLQDPTVVNAAATDLHYLSNLTNVTDDSFASFYAMKNVVTQVSGDFMRYDIGAGTWNNVTGGTPPVTTSSSHQLLGVWDNGQVVWVPDSASTASGLGPGVRRDAYFYNPSINIWEGPVTLPFAVNVFPNDNYEQFSFRIGSSYASAKDFWGNSNIFFLMKQQGQPFITSWGIAVVNRVNSQLVISSFISMVSRTADYPVIEQMPEAVKWSFIQPIYEANTIFLWMDYSLAGVPSRGFKINVSTGTATWLSRYDLPFTPSRFDKTFMGGVGSSDIYWYRENTNEIWKLNINAGTWTDVTNDVNGDIHVRGMIGGQPYSSTFYYFKPDRNFKSEPIPGGAQQGGGGGGNQNTSTSTVRISVSFKDNLGHESNVSNELKLSEIPEGSKVSVDLPLSLEKATMTLADGTQSQEDFVVSRKVYRSEKNDDDGDLFFQQEITDNVTSTVELSVDDTLLVRSVPTAPDDNELPDVGYKYVKFWLNRIHLGNREGFTSRISSSKANNLDAYPLALQHDIGGRDKGELLGFARGSGWMAVPKSSTTWVYRDDVEVGDPVLRLVDYGCEDDGSIFELAGIAGWLSEKGIILFDGFDAHRFDGPIEDYTEKMRGNKIISLANRRYLRLGWWDGIQTTFLLWDILKKRWLIDVYARRVHGLLFGRVAVPANGTHEGIIGLVSDGANINLANLEKDGLGTDAGAAVSALATVLAFQEDGAYSVMNWHSLVLDGNSDTVQNVSVMVKAFGGTR